MADNFLERHREDYEKRKQQWMAKRRGGGKQTPRHREIERPDDEAL